MAVDNSEWGGL